MVKTAGVLTSCKRISSKRTTASEPQQVNHSERTTAKKAVRESVASEPQQANHCEVSREGRKQGKKENIHEICNQA